MHPSPCVRSTRSLACQYEDKELFPTGYPLHHVVNLIPKTFLVAGAFIESGRMAYNKKHTDLDFPLSWMRVFINLAAMHSTAKSPLSIPATINSPTASSTPWFPFFSWLHPSAPEQNTTYPVAVKSFCPLRLTSCSPIISRPTSSQIFRDHLGGAYTVRAFENERVNVEHTHDKFPLWT